MKAWLAVVPAVFAVMNIAGFALMGADKRRAKREEFRVPEAVLFAVAFFFGGATLVASLVMGAMLGIGFYWGREVAQSERKLGTPPWWIGFDVRLWSVDAICDFVCPLVACIAVCLIAFFVF